MSQRIKARVTYVKPAEIHVEFDMGEHHIERKVKDDFMHMLHAHGLAYRDAMFYVDKDNEGNVVIEDYVWAPNEEDISLWKTIASATTPEPLLKYEYKLIELSQKKLELLEETKRVLAEYNKAKEEYSKRNIYND